MELHPFTAAQPLKRLLQAAMLTDLFPEPFHLSEFEVIVEGEAEAGFAYHTDNWKYLYIYVLPAFRLLGLGSQALALCAKRAVAHGRRGSFTSYPSASEAADSFARLHGFQPWYDSARMVLPRTAFPEQPLCVRPYEDADYDEAHALYAQAFHEMRLTIGCFADSVPEKPNENQRREWAETAHERFVCTYCGELAGYAHIEGRELSSIAVKPSLQGQGIGGQFLKALCRHIFQDNDEVVLYCLIGNAARHLYERTGFTEQSRETYAIRRYPEP